MTLTEERMQILKMVEEGTISAGDAAKLLAALENGAQKSDRAVRTINTAVGGRSARWLRIRVTDSGGRQKVSVNLPLGLVNVGLKMGARFVPEMGELDVNELMGEINAAIQEGTQGKIIDVEDHEDGERVEIFVE
jgi:hypothetical protein